MARRTRWDDEEDYDKYERLLKKSRGQRQFSLGFLSKIQKQTIFAVLLLLLALSAKYSNDPTSTAVYGTFQTALSPENDYTVALNDAAKGFLGSSDRSITVNTRTSNLQTPVNGTVVNTFGWQTSSLNQKKRYNSGIDISAPLGSPVYAPLEGTVIRVGTDQALGRYIKLDHGNGLTSILSNFGEMRVKVEQKVKKGQQLGSLGFTSAVKQPWLHWEVRRNNQLVDPQSLNPGSKL